MVTRCKNDARKGIIFRLVTKDWWRNLLQIRRYRLKKRDGPFRPPPPSPNEASGFHSISALTVSLNSFFKLQSNGIASGNIIFLPAPDQSLHMQAEF